MHTPSDRPTLKDVYERTFRKKKTFQGMSSISNLSNLENNVNEFTLVHTRSMMINAKKKSQMTILMTVTKRTIVRPEAHVYDR